MPGIPARQLAILVPIYRSFLDPEETVSLESTFRVLGAHHLVMVKPAGLDTSAIEARFPFKAVETFEPASFASVQGYNRLLLSAAFYERFLGSDFMLICQLDVFVFRDELASWMARGYDYVGAPWISGTAVGLWIHRVAMALGKLRGAGADRVYPYEMRNRVGNGGFSLRKVETHHRLSLVMKDAIDHYLANAGTHHFHEDVFWSMEPAKRGHAHRTPAAEEALAFAWDINPERLFALAGGRLPLAAHGWYRRRHLAFWAGHVAAARAAAT
jgi:hypothetical protein